MTSPRPPILNVSLKSVTKVWKHLLSFSKLALKILVLTHVFSRACCSLFLTHSISTKRECSCNGTEAEDRSSNLVTHHMTAAVSHSLTQSYHLTRSNLLTQVQLKMPSSTTWQSLLRKWKTWKWNPSVNYSILSHEMRKKRTSSRINTKQMENSIPG